MRYFVIIYMITAGLLISCGPPKEAAYQKLYDEVMVIHDEVMPKMSDIHRAKKKLRKLKSAENEELITLQIIALDEADEAMMSWMHDFDKPDLGSLEQDLEYLSKEKEKISAVSDLMLNTITEAQMTIKTYEQ